jgi:hypothetical protein
MATPLEEVQLLSDRVLLAIAEAPATVGVLAFLDVAVRVLKHSNGMDTATACRALARIVEEIGKAEAEQLTALQKET